jgi:hypothetical protein
MSEWHKATVADLSLEDLRRIRDLVLRYLEQWGKEIPPEELARALRQ